MQESYGFHIIIVESLKPLAKSPFGKTASERSEDVCLVKFLLIEPLNFENDRKVSYTLVLYDRSVSFYCNGLVHRKETGINDLTIIIYITSFCICFVCFID